MTYTIGIDMGGTNTDVGFVAADGHIALRSSMPTSGHTDFAVYVEQLAALLKEMEMQLEKIDGEWPVVDGIGIGAPNANQHTGCIENAVNLEMHGVLDFAAQLSRFRSEPVVVGNDANAAAYGELIYGAARGMKSIIMFTLGTGVGSGIVIDGRLVLGRNGNAGELGHATLLPGGRLCSCGRRGCLEAYVSARGIVQTYREMKGLSDGDEISCREIGDLANSGDKTALTVWRTVAWQLALAMANAVAFSAPEAVFVMGGPTAVGAPLLRPLETEFNRQLLSIYKGTCRLLTSQLPTNDVAILGAAALLKMK